MEANMKNTISWIAGAVAILATTLAFADATVTAATGTVSAQGANGPSRPLKNGDVVRQAETVSTGPASGAVLRFDDGEIASLTHDSRMTIESYSYNSQGHSGNIVLNLLQGAMENVTGLIGKTSPDKVAYRAGTTTIGIRGTRVVTSYHDGALTSAVLEGRIVVHIGNQAVEVDAGQAIILRRDHTYEVVSIAALRELLRGTASEDMINLLPQAGAGGGEASGGTPSSSSSTTSAGGGTASGR
jgi:hypothetical protein